MWKRQQLFHATDFQSLMYPNFMFCRILGIFPYKINASTFETSKMQHILQTFFVGVFCIYGLILYQIGVFKSNDMTEAVSSVCFFTCGGFTVITTYILSGPRMRILQAILNISSRLSPESYRKMSGWIHVKDILGTFLLVMYRIVFIYYIRFSERLPYYILGIYIELLTFQMNMTYMNCVCILKTCFKTIDNNLVHLQNVVINDARYVPRFICDTQKNQLLLIEFKSLEKQHLIVSNIFQILNVIFSLQLLITTTLIFIQITLQMYYFIFSQLTRWKDWMSFLLHYEFRDVYFLVNVGYEVLKLVLIVWAFETGKNQAFKIGTTVHDVLNYTSDKQIKEELHLFSLQILHCARNTFTMKGFTIDATLLVTITGSITTYVLILAQFLIMKHSCDGKITSNITQIINLKGDI